MSSTPAPIFNHRKRPRQSLIADPQQNLVHHHPYPGPSGAATYHDLMPPGGYQNMKTQTQQRESNPPSSGQGAAFCSTNSYGNNTNQSIQVGPNSSQYNSPSTNNRQRFSSNNRQSQHVNQTRQENQTLYSQNKQPQSSSKPWYRRPVDPNLNESGPVCFTSNNRQASWSGNSGNLTNKNTSKAVFGNQQTSWNNHSRNQNNAVQRYNNQDLLQNIPGKRGECRNDNEISLYGVNTKMVATSRSGHMTYKEAGGSQRGFSNSTYVSNQKAPNQYRFKLPSNQTISGGVIDTGKDFGDEWDVPFDENTQGINVNHEAKKKQTTVSANRHSQQDVGLRLLTVNVAGIKRWSRFKDSFILLFEMFGFLDSAVTKSSTDCKEFRLRDEDRNAVKCVFFEIDRQIPKMTRGMLYRVVGTYDRSKEMLKCSSVRSTSDRERIAGARLASVCTQVMCGETRELREI